MESALQKKGLCPREAEVAALLSEGLSNREVADVLGISGGTVRKHVDRVFMKLGVRNRATAIRAMLYLIHRAPDQEKPGMEYAPE